MVSTPVAERAAAVGLPRSAAQYSTRGPQAPNSRRKRSSERPTTRNGWPRSASFAANAFPTDPVAPKSPYVIFLICFSLLPMCSLGLQLALISPSNFGACNELLFGVRALSPKPTNKVEIEPG